jgi:hypothetical protein
LDEDVAKHRGVEPKVSFTLVVIDALGKPIKGETGDVYPLGNIGKTLCPGLFACYRGCDQFHASEGGLYFGHVGANGLALGLIDAEVCEAGPSDASAGEVSKEEFLESVYIGNVALFGDGVVPFESIPSECLHEVASNLDPIPVGGSCGGFESVPPILWSEDVFVGLPVPDGELGHVVTAHGGFIVGLSGGGIGGGHCILISL